MVSSQSIARRLSLVNLDEKSFSALLSEVTDKNVDSVFDELGVQKTMYQFVVYAAKYGIHLYLEKAEHALWRRIGGGGGPSIKSYQELVDFTEAWINNNVNATAALLSGCSDAVLLKGAAIRCYLPDYRRYQVDADIYLHSSRSACATLRRLDEAGYELQGRLLTKLEKGKRFVHAQCSKIGLNVGLHSCWLPMGSLRYPVLLGVDILERSNTLLSKKHIPDCRVPSKENMVIVLVAHVLRHGYLLHRDINDLYMFFSRFDLDVHYIMDSLGRNGLDEVFRAMLLRLSADYGLEPIPVRAGLMSRAYLWLLERGVVRTLLCGFVVKCHALFWRRRRQLGRMCALIEGLRSFGDLIALRVSTRNSTFRAWHERMWKRFMPQDREIEAFSSIDEFLSAVGFDPSNQSSSLETQGAAGGALTPPSTAGG